MHSVYVPLLYKTDHHHHVPPHSTSYNACIQYMHHCSRNKTPLPPPPPHSASYNIAATTTCVSGVSVLVGHRKRPPVQVTVTTTICASRVSALFGHRKRPPMQVTVGPCQHTHYSHHHMCQKVQWLKKKTTSASYSWSEPAPPPLECTLQQANVTCLRACH